LCSCLTIAVSCKRESNSQPAQYPPYGQPYPQQQYPGSQQAPGQYPAQQQPAPGSPQQVQPGPVMNAATDPINRVDLSYLRADAQTMLNELVAALPATYQARVQGIPLVVDSTPGEVNAFAACTKDGRSAMAITDGLLDIAAHLARARAIDELAGSRKVDEYVRFFAQNQRPHQPIAQPAPGFFDPRFDTDQRKLVRQQQLLDEELGFIMGHELAHHYLGHLPCTAGVASAAELNHVLTDVVPAFNQFNEAAADINGTNSVLTTGARRQGYHLTEGGGLLTMQFFAGLDQSSPLDILDYSRTHPPPSVRTLSIQQTAATWRAFGGRWTLPVF
jgi:Zn-dependent protease with chaperone function